MALQARLIYRKTGRFSSVNCHQKLCSWRFWCWPNGKARAIQNQTTERSFLRLN
jgi:hypothetical protein